MITCAMQLKAKIRNVARGDSMRAQTLARIYMMERFLERCSLSPYRENIILKGGMFVASNIGLDLRSTMDIDTTFQSLTLSKEIAEKVILEIINIQLEDNVGFEIKSSRRIMEEHDYPGLRFMIDAHLDRMVQPIRIDISTGDVITPAAINYSYKLMFEERFISVMSYNIETVLSEKMHAILSNDTANTRMRDYYDVYMLLAEKKDSIQEDILRVAFSSVCKKRGFLGFNAMDIITRIRQDEHLSSLWNDYRKDNYYVGALEWDEVIVGTVELAKLLKII